MECLECFVVQLLVDSENRSADRTSLHRRLIPVLPFLQACGAGVDESDMLIDAEKILVDDDADLGGQLVCERRGI